MSATSLVAHVGTDVQSPEGTPTPTVAANLGARQADATDTPSEASPSFASDAESAVPAAVELLVLTVPVASSHASASGSGTAASPRVQVRAAGAGVRGSFRRGSLVVFLGDSYTSGWNGAGIGARGWPRIVASARHSTAVNLAVPGTGFVDPGWTGQPVGALVGGAIKRHPDVVVLAAGHNDFNWSRSATRAAADAVIMRIHRSLPRALLVVVGPIWQNGRPPASLVALRDHLRREAAAAHALFIDPIAERWFAGSRHALIGPDGIHPTDRGHRFMATRVLADLARAGV